LKEGPDLSVSPLHILPLGSTPLELDPETLRERSTSYSSEHHCFIVLTVHNSLSTLILVALELKLHV
jgi:hypothetical protein